MIYGPSFSAPVTAAGAVLRRGAGNARAVAVVHRPYGAWCFPEGRTAPGELRIAEESFATGRPAPVCAELAAIQELSRRLAPVPVEAMIPEGGRLVLDGTPERVVSVERHLA